MLSCLTNFITDQMCDESSDGEIQQFFSEIFVNDGGIFGFCATFPDLRFFICPPNVRNKPYWYSRLRPSIIRAFHQFLLLGPANLQAIEDFSGELDRDQIHFTMLSGIYYVQHIADQVVALLGAPVPSAPIRLVHFILIKLIDL